MAKDKKSGGAAILVALLISVTLIAGIWVYLMKTNKFINLGETLRPYIKDVPVLNLLLPDVPDESNPEVFGREELELKYKTIYDENKNLTVRVSELEKQLSEKEDVTEKYEILLKEVDTLNKEIANNKEKQINEEEESKKEELKNLVKVYETMDPGEAAKILEQMGTLNITLVIEIVKEMKSSNFSAILQEMDNDFAAILSERMLNE